MAYVLSELLVSDEPFNMQPSVYQSSEAITLNELNSSFYKGKDC
jgi:hypothetical protein